MLDSQRLSQNESMAYKMQPSVNLPQQEDLYELDTVRDKDNKSNPFQINRYRGDANKSVEFG